MSTRTITLESHAETRNRPEDWDAPKSVRVWIGWVCFLLVTLTTIGGITRLTGSGLSITDWKPIMGAIPPLTEDSWIEAFQKYQEIPQYKIVNSTMTLSEFKQIFFWEWLHRFIARTIGIVVLVPALLFWFRRQISKKVFRRTLGGFALGGLQGALGWFMVMSGLSERVSVSHFRLAAHLSLALVILAYFTWLLRDLQTKKAPLDSRSHAGTEKIRPLFRVMTGLLIFQIIYGALVAGLKAGWGFNTWPKMNGEWIPGNFMGLDGGFFLNTLSNPAAVHWIHRTNGLLLAGTALLLWARARGIPRGSELRRYSIALSHATLAQFWVGVMTVVLVIPLPLAVFHQFFAALLVMILTTLGHTLSRSDSSC